MGVVIAGAAQLPGWCCGPSREASDWLGPRRQLGQGDAAIGSQVHHNRARPPLLLLGKGFDVNGFGLPKKMIRRSGPDPALVARLSAGVAERPRSHAPPGGGVA